MSVIERLREELKSPAPAHLPRGRVGVPHLCPVPDCTVGVSPGHVACKRHWLRVRTDDRHLLATVFRDRESNPEAFAEAVQIATQLVVKAAAR